MLYLVSTPIGNLSDITLRALEILKSVDIILCEDTRHSLRLLSHYQIQKPLKSYHQFNEKARLDELMTDLQAGKQIALISDAGTPSINDPGYHIVKKCRDSKIPVYALPGPCALITALTVSGLPTERFQFMGFLPKKQSHLRETWLAFLCYPGTSICYETPHHILDSLESLAEIAPQQKIIILRELTKLHEEYLEGTAPELIAHFHKKTPLGEMVILMEGSPPTFQDISPEAHVRALQTQYSLELSEAIKLAATLRDVPKRTLYNLFHQ